MGTYTNMTGSAGTGKAAKRAKVPTEQAIPERYRKAHEAAQAAKAKRDTTPTTADTSNLAGEGSGIAQSAPAQNPEGFTQPVVSSGSNNVSTNIEEAPLMPDIKPEPKGGDDNAAAGVAKSKAIINELDSIMSDIDKQK